MFLNFHDGTNISQINKQVTSSKQKYSISLCTGSFIFFLKISFINMPIHTDYHWTVWRHFWKRSINNSFVKLNSLNVSQKHLFLPFPKYHKLKWKIYFKKISTLTPADVINKTAFIFSYKKFSFKIFFNHLIWYFYVCVIKKGLSNEFLSKNISELGSWMSYGSIKGLLNVQERVEHINGSSSR